MVYGDLQLVDIIIFAGIALFLVYRLRSVLGKRTGFEGRPKQHHTTEQQKEKEPKKIETPELESKFSKLKIAYEKINDFDHNQFLDGAKIAFETIINAFNKGDKKTLKPLLTKEVFQSFEEAISKNSINKDYQFYSLNIEKIEDVIFESGNIKICVKFISEQFKNDDENTILKKEDTWTFEKPINSKNPNWLLSST